MTINTRKSVFILFFSLFLFHFSLLHAQEKRDEKVTSAEKINSVQATGDAIKFKDESSNELIKVVDEGNFGSIELSSGIPSVTANKLYRNNGFLYFNGNPILTNNSVVGLSDLADVNSDNVSYLFLGIGSGSSNIGQFNTSLGLNSLHLNQLGRNNTALGYLTLYSNVSGINNVAIGTNVLQFNNGSCNTGVGNFSLNNNLNGTYNTAIGDSTLFSNTSGTYNTAVGKNALLSNNTGNYNTAIGWKSLNKNTATLNTAIGALALEKNTTGVSNTAIGVYTLNSNTDGSSNTAIGTNSLFSNTGGGNNTALGKSTLNSNTSGSNNVAIGVNALQDNTSGSTNIAIGNFANSSNQNGTGNVMIGYFAGSGTQNISKSSNIFIGFKAGQFENGSNLLYIENSESSAPLIWGNFENDIAAINGKFGVGTQAPSDKVEIVAATGEDALRVKIDNATKLRVLANGGTTIGANFAGTPANGLYVAGDIQNPSGVLHSSDIRFKKNITSIPNCIESIKFLNGIYYDWKTEEFPDRNFNNKRQIGVIAQEVEKVFPELVSTDNEGYKSVNYSKLSPLLIEAIKEQEIRIEHIINQNEELVKQNLEFRNINIELQNEIVEIKAILSQITDLREKVSLTKNEVQ
ncbi:MAG: tail fiber domain-containing protein [Ignavibacteriae bacterium]|nr:tail fiber domain-containing protein [Ignavibacteriota bacterium]